MTELEKSRIGQTFNRLKIIGLDDERNKLERERLKRGEISKCGKYYKCECTCKNMKTATYSSLKLGDVKSCGCLRYKSHKEYNTYDLTGDYGIGWTAKGQEFIFDLEDYNRIKEYTWYYANGYIKANKKEKVNGLKTYINLHKFITKTGGNEIIDHKNRIKTDCRKPNLRISNYLKNGLNKTISKRNKSGYTGVLYNKKWKVWISAITYNGKYHKLYRGIDLQEAIRCRLQGELDYFGADYAPQRELFEQYNITTKSPTSHIQ